MTKEDFDLLLTTDSVKIKEKLLKEIDARVSDIVSYIYKIAKVNFSYWDWTDTEDYSPPFSNRNYRKDYNGISICAHGKNLVEFIDKDGSNRYLNEDFPANWIWEDDKFKEELPIGLDKAKKAIEIEKQEKQQQEKQLEELKKQYRNSAMGKLSPEEKWALGLSKKFQSSKVNQL